MCAMTVAKGGAAKDGPREVPTALDVDYLTYVVPLMRSLGVVRFKDLVIGPAPVEPGAPKAPETTEDRERRERSARMARLRRALGSGIMLDETMLGRIVDATS